MSQKVHKDDPQKMAALSAWLDVVIAELDLDKSIMEANQKDLLGLISAVAHGPSRPGAPLTAFLVGWAAGSGQIPVSESIARLTARIEKV